MKDVTIDGVSKAVEFRFCIPTEVGEKSSLAYVLDADNNRVQRLTSGDLTFAKSDTKRAIDEDGEEGDIIGLTYTSFQTTEICQAADAEKGLSEVHYTTEFEIKCNKKIHDVRHNLLSFVQDKDNKCNFKASVEHVAGCPTLELSGFVQYVMGHPWIIAGALIAFGVAACFFGGLLFDWVVAALAGICAFFVVAMVIDTFGGFDVLKVRQALKAGPVFFAVISFAASLAAGIFAGYIVKKTARIAKAVLGCVAGIFAGFLLYSLVLGKLAPNATWLYIVTELVCFFAGGYLVYKHDKKILVQLTALVGAYTIVRGISLIAGGFPSEFAVIGQMASGNFDVPATFYAYLAGFATLAVGGTYFQWSKNYHTHIHGESDDLGDGYKAV